jgi:ATP-binding cassette subfamily E protein 1
MKISMKPQTITPKFEGTVRQLFFKKIKAAFLSPQFQTDVVKPLKLEDFIDQEVKNLSGGELQRVCAACPCDPPSVFLLTLRRWPLSWPLVSRPISISSMSPLLVSLTHILFPESPHLTCSFRSSVLILDPDLDSEQRIIASRVIKRFIMHAKKTAFIVEHDFIMATYLADQVIVFDGKPGIDAHANKPESLLTGCNTFLKNLDVTFRRDPTNFRPRINKLNSQLDQEQKLNGNYVSLVMILSTRPATDAFYHSSSWRMSRRALEKGVPEDNHKHDRRPPHDDASDSGVLGVQNGGSCRNQPGGARGGLDGASEESVVSEDDDPYI